MGPRFLHVEPYDEANRAKALQDIAEKRALSAPYMEMLAASPGSRRQTHHATMYYRVYLTKDVPIAVGCLSEVLRRRLLDMLGLEDETVAYGFDPTSAEAVAAAAELTRRAEEIFAAKSSAEWLEILEERGIPAGPVKFAEELFVDEQIQANGLLVQAEHPGCGNRENDGAIGEVRRRQPGAAGPAPGTWRTFRGSPG